MLFYISIFFVPLFVWLILRTVSKQNAGEETEPQVLLEVCALCHEEFEMSELIEQEVGEYGRVYCFCGGCIGRLHGKYHAQMETAETRGNVATNEAK